MLGFRNWPLTETVINLLKPTDRSLSELVAVICKSELKINLQLTFSACLQTRPA